MEILQRPFLSGAVTHDYKCVSIDRLICSPFSPKGQRIYIDDNGTVDVRAFNDLGFMCFPLCAVKRISRLMAIWYKVPSAEPAS